MACIDVTQVIDLEIAADQTIEIVLSLIGGILIAIIIIALILIVRCRRVIIRMLPDRCRCCFCCVAICPCCLKSKDEERSAYLISSWGEPELLEDQEAETKVETDEREGESPTMLEMEMDETLVLDNPGYSEFTIDTGGNLPGQAELEDRMDTESPSSTVPLLQETNFIDGAEDKFSSLMQSAGPSLADVFIAPKGKQTELLKDCENRAIMKLESSFLQNWADFFLMHIETLATNLVASEQVDEKWKAELLNSCQSTVDEALRRYKSKAVAEIGNISTDKEALQMAGFDVGTVKEDLIKTIYFNLKETEISAAEVEEVMNDFEESMRKFEVLFSKIYLQEVTKLQNRLILKELLTDKVLKNTEQLVSEMRDHQKKHYKALERIQMDASSSLSKQNNLAPQVKKIWASAIKKFDKELNKQKYVLRDDINQRIDRSIPWDEFRQETKIKMEELIKREITIEAFIDCYCSKLQDVLDAANKQDYVEINFAATEFNALVEILGIKKLKKGMHKERALYTEFTSQSGWVPSDILRLITQLQTELDNLQASLRSVRQQQESEIRALMNTPVLGPPLDHLYLGNVKVQQSFIPKILEIQVDLSEKEQEALKEKAEAQLKCYEVQFEITKLKYEQSLRSDIKEQRLRLASKRARLGGNMTSDNSIKATIELDKEEQSMESAHKQAVEDTKKKLMDNINAAKKNWEFMLQQQIERIRRGHENDITFVNKQEKALSTLKSKLLERISDDSERERLLQEYQINLKVLDEEIQKSKERQEQVLQQKIEARKLEKLKEKERQNIKSNVGAEPYKKGSAKRFAANCLVSLLMEVRHQHSLKEMEQYHVQESDKLKSQLHKRYDINTKLSIQLHEREMVMKLASALNMSRQELEKELSESSDSGGIKSLLPKSVLDSYEIEGADTKKVL